MKIVVAPRAAAQILARKRWWRANRRKALVQIAKMPESFPVFSERGGRIVRRCLLGKTSCHLYFEVDASASEVWVVAARGAVQGRVPPFPGR